MSSALIEKAQAVMADHGLAFLGLALVSVALVALVVDYAHMLYLHYRMVC